MQCTETCEAPTIDSMMRTIAEEYVCALSHPNANCLPRAMKQWNAQSAP